MDWIRANRGFSLLVTNVVLAVFLFFLTDPFEWIRTGYAGARALVSASQSSVSSIEIIDPESGGSRIVLTRGEKAGADKKSDSPFKLQATGQEFNWQVEITRPGKDPQKFSADRENVRGLFEAIEKSRRYYSVGAEPAKLADLDMGRDSSGRPVCLQIILKSSGNPDTLCVGRASVRTSESHVRVNDEDKVYLVQSNLRSAAGAGDPDHFRNRQILSGLKRDSITALNAVFTKGERTVQLGKSGDSWQMTSPLPGKVNPMEMASLIGDIVEWKATRFLDKAPAELEKNTTFQLEIVSKGAGDVPEAIRVEVLGQKDYSSYVVRTPGGELVEVNSAYLGHLLKPEEKLLSREK